jgi:hypothetical protein
LRLATIDLSDEEVTFSLVEGSTYVRAIR